MPARGRSLLATAAGVAALVPAVAPAAAAPPTTSYRTVTGDQAKPYSTLRTGPGWKRVVRDDLGAAPQRGRSVRRRSLTYFAQLSDFQLADEESPARVETLDPRGGPFTAAWRPQEALVPHLTDLGIRAVNQFTRSPLRSQTRCVRRGRRVARCAGKRFAALDLAITTGDSADNQQRNEVQWVVNLLEGRAFSPGSGVESAAPCPGGQVPAGEAARYTGVQDADDVPESAEFYDPDRPAGAFAAFPRWPGLMDRAQQAFQPEGLKVPSYVAFGNHDGTVQGNVWASQPLEDVVVGCVKPLSPGGFPGLEFLQTGPARGVAVPPDPDRTFVSRKAYMDLHRTGKQADAHGFGLVDPAEAKASNGFATYFSVAPRKGIRFVSINTVADGANTPNSDGNLDDPQFRWLERTLEAADRARELVVLFGHHPIRSLNQPENDEGALPCSAPVSGPGCDGDPRRSTPIHDGADLQALLLAHPSAIAYVAGHTHEHQVTPFRRPGGRGGFWGIESASHVDWPIQSRLLEVLDNGDGTLSIFGTVIDNAAPLSTPPAGTDASAFDARTLAAIGRELSFNDPQAGAPGGEGRPQDRNVELLLPDPRRR
jgi:metallophosphoesterase (TIGR03767 family)